MSKKFFHPTIPRRFSLELLLIIAIAIAILIRFLNLGNREFWYDEVLSLLFATVKQRVYNTPGDVPVALSDLTSVFSLPVESSFKDTIGTFRTFFNSLKGDVHPFLSYLSLHFWVRMFGTSEAALRSLVSLLSVAAIGSAYGLGRRLLSHRGGLILAALLATNPFYLSHSLNIRMYAPLVLWTILSTWAMLMLIDLNQLKGNQKDAGMQGQAATQKDISPSQQIFWSLILIISVTGGLLTQYLFFYWVLTLAIFVVVCDRSHWWQQGLRLGAGVILVVPWFLWGTRQQLRNRGESISQISGEDGLPLFKHLQETVQTLGNHLILGDWATSTPKNIPTVVGCIAIALLIAVIINLWQKREHRLLKVALLLGILPLLLALAVDIITNKYTIGFGWGRAMIFVLPGCLLLLAVWLEKVSGRWQGTAVTVLLLLYLTISIGDLSLRPRRMFHQIADMIQQAPQTPTLMVMNSNAWGHVLRLAYYMPNTAPVKLLVQPPAKVAAALSKVLADPQTSIYPRILWLESANPVWGTLKTDAEKEDAREKVQAVLNSGFQLQKTQQLLGTMNMDDFTVKLYTRSNPS